MKAMGTLAHDPRLTAESLFGAAERVRDDHPDESEALSGYAHDLATIQNLPTFGGWVRGESNA